MISAFSFAGLVKEFGVLVIVGGTEGTDIGKGEEVGEEVVEAAAESIFCSLDNFGGWFDVWSKFLEVSFNSNG